MCLDRLWGKLIYNLTNKSCHNTLYLVTPKSFHSITFALLGSSGVSNEAKTYKELSLFDFSCCFPVIIERTLKNRPRNGIFWHILDVFEDYSILAEKQRLKPKKLCSLKIFASFDTPLDPRRAKVMECNDLGGIYSSV